MKRISKILIIILCINITNAYAQDHIKEPLNNLLKESLVKLDTCSSPNRYAVCAAELKRIMTIYPKEWILGYYVSFVEIQEAFNNLSKDNDRLLDDALDNITLLKNNKNADQSEVSTLEGYYYSAIIAKDPSKNGAIYYKNVLNSYQKGLKYNPNNPRASLLILIFNNNLARFMGGAPDQNISSKIEKIDSLFQNESIDNYLKPFWGRKILDNLKKSVAIN